MPVQIIKPRPNPKTAQRVTEVGAALGAMVRAMAPAVQKAGEEMGRSFERLRTQRPA
ncbi:hypothetical protein [Streptomyces rubradiris]|uniref:Uncharacterized protein n=1 Tax=Streptomyces rubradiris TaxID=285531 RepID=A0ABQ3R3F4_STRRR|nr:hypothetical protein [Streptomyces rubradiris]GHH30118.1 hypothetical protein GCM10018792_76150 [Streptomyces rubradiris]GHI50396.1 hypothetical protein Srubr_02420 [Streptomyces rubradiris]